MPRGLRIVKNVTRANHRLAGCHAFVAAPAKSLLAVVSTWPAADRLLLADTEFGEDFAKNIIAVHFPDDGGEGVERKP